MTSTSQEEKKKSEPADVTSWGSFTNDVYLSAIQMLERVVSKKKSAKMDVSAEKDEEDTSQKVADEKNKISDEEERENSSRLSAASAASDCFEEEEIVGVGEQQQQEKTDPTATATTTADEKEEETEGLKRESSRALSAFLLSERNVSSSAFNYPPRPPPSSSSLPAKYGEKTKLEFLPGSEQRVLRSPALTAEAAEAADDRNVCLAGNNEDGGSGDGGSGSASSWAANSYRGIVDDVTAIGNGSNEEERVAPVNDQEEQQAQAGEIEENMNFFRNRFQRPQSRRPQLNAEDFLRDCSSRRRASRNNHNRGKNDDDHSDGSQRTRSSDSSSRRRRSPHQLPSEERTFTSDIHKVQATTTSTTTTSLSSSSSRPMRRRRPAPVEESGSNVEEVQKQQQKQQDVFKTPAEMVAEERNNTSVALSKKPSLRRRRYPSDKSSDDWNPTKKGNYESQSAKLGNGKQGDHEEDEKDPLGFIEVKSAAQWKAMSNRISWKFEEPEEDKSFNFTVNSLGESNANENSSVEGFKPTTVQKLRLICWRVKPWKQPKTNSRMFSSQFGAGWGVDCDEVYPGLYVGDKASATNVGFLQKLGITHVLNTAEGKDEGLVDLSGDHYEGSSIHYMGFPLWDTPTCNLVPYLGCASDFIASALDNNGKCLVNCQMGVSRSASCAMAYLLIKGNMTAVEALTQMRYHRDVRPNDGFLEQLVQLDNSLRMTREHGCELTFKLSTLRDLPMLPRPWNYEFWTKPVTEEEIGLPLVKLGEAIPASLARHMSSPQSSLVSSRVLSRRSSRRSNISGNGISRSVSRHGSFRQANNEEENQNRENAQKVDPSNSSEPRLTAEELEKVKAIIEKPEERWRWQPDLQQPRDSCDTPSSVSSSVHSSLASSNLSNLSNLSTTSVNVASNLIQPGVDGGDPLSLVTVASAKQWKAISQKLSINLDGIDLDETATSSTKDCVEFSRSPRPHTPIEFVPTTVKQLRLLCWRIKPWDQPRARHLFSSVLASGWGVDCDEVYPNLFIGDEASARNIRFLNKLGITHVLNAAEGKWTDCSFVDLSSEYYAGTGITYQGLQIWDSTKVRILPFFGCADEFISTAIAGGGKCLVHCQMGVSRSCSSAMAYMMLTEKWDAADVMAEFRKRRDVRPNDHFLAQIVELDNDLRKERLFNLPRRLKLYTLADLPFLPKPWHYEFWDAEPDPDTLPFQLCHMGEDVDNLPRDKPEKIFHLEEVNDVKNVDLVHRSMICSQGSAAEDPTEKASCGSETSGEWEWEYYDSEEEPMSEKTASKTEDLSDRKDTKRDSTDLSSTVKESSKVVKSVSSSEQPRNNSNITGIFEIGLMALSKTEWASSYSISEKKDVGKGNEDERVDEKTEGNAREHEEVTVEEKQERVRPLRDMADFLPTTEKQLRLICWRVKPWSKKSKSKLFSSQYAILWQVDCDEVHPNLFIGDEASARNIKFLRHLNITHVLNTAEGEEENLVDLSQDYYEGTGISYLGFLMWDSTWFDVRPFIDEAVTFIRSALANGGKCLVNCQMGVSRSSTCALAYMMTEEGMTADAALTQFRTHRDVRPNDGFIKFLVELDNDLRKKREGFV